MKFSQRKRIFLTRLLLLVGLFVQTTLVAHACVSPEASAVKALSQAGRDSCHHTASASINECLMHCTQEQQVNTDHHAVALVNIDAAVLHVALLDRQENMQVHLDDNSVIDTGPPLSIRFCTFLL